MTAETAKRLNHRDALLALLSDGRWHHMTEMQRVGGWRYGARAFELKQQGRIVEKRKIGVDAWEYRLLMDGQGVLL